ncbi:MAG: tyrosine-type recombinase/integrase [Alphaproteobacteria bacterium]
MVADRSDSSAVCQSYGSTDLAVAEDISAALGRATELIEASHAPATIEAYRLDMADWYAWADPRGVATWPIEVPALAAYIAHLETTGKSVSTISRRCAAISRLHRDHGIASPTSHPTIGRLLKGLRREHAGQKAPKRAFTPDLIRGFVSNESTSARDRALIAVGFVTGLRRAELTALEWSDLSNCPVSTGLILHIRRSKNDQIGEGAYVAIPKVGGSACPVGLLLEWQKSAENRRIFPISTSTVLRVAKRVATLAGLDPAPYGAHSLRSGLCTTAAVAGVSLAESMQASRHKSADVAASYVGTISAGENRAHKAAAEALAEK